MAYIIFRITHALVDLTNPSTLQVAFVCEEIPQRPAFPNTIILQPRTIAEDVVYVDQNLPQGRFGERVQRVHP